MAGLSGSGSRLRTSTPVPASKCNKDSNQHQGADSDFMSFFALAPSNSFFSSPSPLHFVLLSQGTLGKGRLTGEPWQALMSASYGLSPGLIATPERSSNLFAELASAEGIVEEGAILLSWSARDQPTCRLGPFDPRQLQGNPPFQVLASKEVKSPVGISAPEERQAPSLSIFLFCSVFFPWPPLRRWLSNHATGVWDGESHQPQKQQVAATKSPSQPQESLGRQGSFNIKLSSYQPTPERSSSDSSNARTTTEENGGLALTGWAGTWSPGWPP